MRNTPVSSTVSLSVAVAALCMLVAAPRPAWAADDVRLDAPTAIENVTIIPSPGKIIEKGTILMQDGRVLAMGESVDLPPGVRKVDGKGLFAYAGFVDALTRRGTVDVPADAITERRVEDEFPSVSAGPWAATVAANRAGILARMRVEQIANIEATTFDDARKGGFTAALLTGPQSVVGPLAAVVQLGGEPLRRSILRGGVAHGACFNAAGHADAERGRYPSTPFGVIAHFRQLCDDALWYREMGRYVEKHAESRGELPYDADLEAVLEVLDGKRPLLWEAGTADEIHRVLNLAEELGFKPVIVGGREAYKVAERLNKTGTPVLVSLKLPNEPREYKLDPAALQRKSDDETLYGKNWEDRPFDAKAAYEWAGKRREEMIRNVVELEKAGVKWAFAGYELGNNDNAIENLAEIVKAGLSEEAALRGLTTAPAGLYGIEQQVGTLEPGRLGNVAVLTKKLGDKDAKVRWVFVEGRKFDVDTSAAADSDEDGSGDQAGRPGRAGRGEGRRGGRNRPDGERRREREESAEASSDQSASQPASQTGSQPASQAGSQPASQPITPSPYDDILFHEPTWTIETEADRDPGLKTGGNVLLKNALLLTVSGEDLPGTSVLIQNGKIVKIGKGIAAPQGVTEIDLTGYTIMPGMIDPHSHIALDAINEGSLSVTPEVRCEDVVRHDDADVFRAVAGGTTTIHSMHGSANSIGGQNVMMKLKYGRPSAEMIIHDRPRTVKFATGENVKRPGMPGQRSFGGDAQRPPLRFPGSRMGVEVTMRRALEAGREYGQKWAAYEADKKAGKDVKPMRRDLRLEALADIVAGRIWVHSHCYRADEILRLLSVAEDFGFRIAVLQHVLEGYRIMPEIARHGCGASTFSDWWAYKIEAYHAVPQNAGMMQRYGINATINSDSSDLIRHLNFEAAKCMKYSGLTANEALRLASLNGAVQLGLDKRVGSIEVGKDGDIAVFDGHPLDTFAKCVMTFIEGECYFRHRDFDPAASLHDRPVRQPPVTLAVSNAGNGTTMLDPRGTNGHMGSDGDTGSNGTSSNGGSSNGGGGQAGSSGAQTGSNDTWTALNQPNPHNMFAIVGGTVHPVSGPAIEGGTVVIKEGKIDAVGRDIAIPRGAMVLDAKGRHVWPGLIDAGTGIGMYEIGQVEVTVDTGETGTYQPDVRAVSAFNPHSATVAVTCADGVLTALVAPTSPTVAGQAGLVNLSGWSMAEMLVEPEVGLVVNLPSRRAKPIVEAERRRGRRFGGGAAAADDDAGPAKALKELEQFFRDAKLYAEAKEAAGAVARPPSAGPAGGAGAARASGAGGAAGREPGDSGATGRGRPGYSDPRFDAMAPYATGRKPVIFRVNGYKEILEVLLFAAQLEIKPILYGGRDAWRLADVLAKRQVPVIYTHVFSVPGDTGVWDSDYRALSVMAQAGVKFCLANESATLAKLMPLEAGFAVAHGLDPEVAVRAMTLSAAEILGVADRLGSLDPGKAANVIVTTDHVCQATSAVTAAFINGRPVSLENQHTELARKFAERPKPNLPPAPKLVGPPSQTR